MDTVLKYLTFENRTEPIIVRLSSRNFEDIRLPRDTMYFVICDVNEQGKESNWSKIYALGKKYGYDEAKAKFKYEDDALVILTAVLEGMCEQDCDLIHFENPYHTHGSVKTRWDVFDPNKMTIVSSRPDPRNQKQIIPVA